MQLLLHPSVFVCQLLELGRFRFESLHPRSHLRHDLISEIITLIAMLLNLSSQCGEEVLKVLLHLLLLREPTSQVLQRSLELLDSTRGIDRLCVFPVDFPDAVLQRRYVLFEYHPPRSFLLHPICKVES